MPARRTLVLGTHNRKKLAELQMLLEPHGFDLRTLAQYDDPLEVEETGATFAENARLKAIQQAQHLQQWVLAEDSGLSVVALDGAPGVYSARFAGVDATDQQNNELLLERLNGCPAERRTAYYTCHLTLADSDGQVQIEVEDTCWGRITEQPRGDGGFGYDPLFKIPEYHRTFGELGPQVKAILSHRARASRHFVRQLLSLIGAGRWPVDKSTCPS